MRGEVVLLLLSSAPSLSNALVFRFTIDRFAPCGDSISAIFESFHPTIPNADVIHELLKSPNRDFEKKWKASFQEDDSNIETLFPLLEYPKYHETLFSGEFILSNTFLTDAFFGGSDDASKTIYTGNFLVESEKAFSIYDVSENLLVPLLKYSVRNNLSQAESYQFFELIIDRNKELINVFLDELSSQNHFTPAILAALPRATFGRRGKTCLLSTWMPYYLSENLSKDQLTLRLIHLMDGRQNELGHLLKGSLLKGAGQNSDYENFLKDKFDQIENNPMTLFVEISNMRNTPDSPEDLRYQVTYVSAHMYIGTAALGYIKYEYTHPSFVEEWDRVMNSIQSILFGEEYKSRISPVEKRCIISSIMNDLLEDKYFWTAERRKSFLEQVRQDLPLNSIPESFWPVEEKLKSFKREANVIIIDSAAQDSVDLPNFDVDLDYADDDGLPTLPINLLVPNPHNESEFVPYHELLIDEMQTMLDSNSNSFVCLRNYSYFLNGDLIQYNKLAASWVYLLYFNMKMDLSKIFGDLSQKKDWRDLDSMCSFDHLFKGIAVNRNLLNAIKNYSIPFFISLEEFRQLVDSSFKPGVYSNDSDSDSEYHSDIINENCYSNWTPSQFDRDVYNQGNGEFLVGNSGFPNSISPAFEFDNSTDHLENDEEVEENVFALRRGENAYRNFTTSHANPTHSPRFNIETFFSAIMSNGNSYDEMFNNMFVLVNPNGSANSHWEVNNGNEEDSRDSSE